MNNNIAWIFEITLKEGKFENLKKLMTEMVTATKENEVGALVYEWTINKDNTICHTYERYADSEVTLAHLAIFLSKYAERLMEIGDATNFVVYGNPSDEVKKILDGFNATYMTPIGGFIR